ncbi:MAG: cadherin-like domain-containing protein [Kofleriaceae bacterium]|nr:cadherin-like domain-containing protein [Kofleriaceae bacterium]
MSTGIPPVNATTAGTVAEGGTISLDGKLVSADGDTGATELVYTVGALPTTGMLKKDNVAVTAGATFTQQEINDGRISYTHDGGESAADAFTWRLSDGSNVIPASGTTPFTITVTPVNDPPTIVNNPVSTVPEGGMEVLSNARLQAADAEGGVLTFTFLGISRGQLQKNSVALATNGTFTQTDIANGLVRFVDPGTDDTNLAMQSPTSATFQWRVSDPSGGVNPPTGSNVSTFTISSVDDPVAISWRTQRCASSGTNILANPVASITDPDNALSDYSVCVVSISAGESYVSMVTTGGGTVTVTVTVVPVLQNGNVTLSVGSCVPANALTNLNLDSSATNYRGAVVWKLMKGAVQVGNNATVEFPVTPTSC